MEYCYYKTFCFLNHVTEIVVDDVQQEDLFYRFYYEPELDAMVGERNLNNIFDQVYYYNPDLQKVLKYHAEHFKGSDFFYIVQQLMDYTILVRYYENKSFLGAELYNHDVNYEQIESYRFDKMFKLLEYRTPYHSQDNKKFDKVFVPSLWRIFDDK